MYVSFAFVLADEVVQILAQLDADVVEGEVAVFAVCGGQRDQPGVLQVAEHQHDFVAAGVAAALQEQPMEDLMRDLLFLYCPMEDTRQDGVGWHHPWIAVLLQNQ